MSDLINRQTLLAQMDAQQQAFDTEMKEYGKTPLVKPSWELAISMIKDMKTESYEAGVIDGAERLAEYMRTTHLTIDEALEKIRGN